MKQSDVFLALLLHGGGGGGGVLATAPRPLLIERQSDFDVVFCQGAHYSSGASCEVDGVPSYGTGYCATLSAEPGQCRTFSDFGPEAAQLYGNVSFAYIPLGRSVSLCRLYKTPDCTGAAAFAGLGTNGWACGNQASFKDNVFSFSCS